MASGRSDPEIQVALRWASAEALKIYKVANVEDYAGWLTEAERQEITGMRAIGLPRAPARPLPPHDHLDRALELLDNEAELCTGATAADADLVRGIAFGNEDTPMDYDPDSW